MALTKTPIELSSTPGIVDNSNATAITIDSSENVLVGTTSTSIPNQSSNTGIFLFGGGSINVARSGDECAIFNRLTSDGEIVRIQKDGTTVGSIGTNAATMYVSAPQAGGMKYSYLTSTNAVMLPVTTTGASADGLHDLGLSAARFRDLYLSGGAYLGGTAAAHKLDDYEEVNFTATIRGSLAEPATLITATGYATRIGRVVQYSIGFEAVNTTGYSGIVTITGLPFTNNGGRAIGNLVGYRGLAWGGSDCFSVIQMNGTNIEGFSISSASIWAEATHNGDSSAYFWLTGTYMTTA